MVRSWPLSALTLVAAVLLGPSALAQQAVSEASGKEGALTAKAEAPASIFNERVRRYCFALEGALVTSDTAEAFVVHHQGAKDRPRIFGAYADDECNALVVVAPPEAEQAIRETLAQWLIASRGIELSPSLKGQRRALESRWRVVLGGMAEVEVQLVNTTGDRAQQLRDRLQLYETELTTLEKQLRVIDRYIARLAAGPSSDQ